MITMLGNRICKDCAAALVEIERLRLPIEFHDMETSMEYLKEFLLVREGHPELFDECRKNNGIGIPVFVLEDGKVTFSCDEAFEAAKKIKAPVVTMVGTHLCPGCRARLEQIKAEGLYVEFHDLFESMHDMRMFLNIREGHPEIYDKIREVGRVGVPVFILPNGTVTIDGDLAMDEMRKLK